MNVSAVDTRHHIAAVLGSWAQVVVEERGVPAPDRSVARLVGFLTEHLDWLTSQAPAGDFADEVDGLGLALLRVVDPEHSGRRLLATVCVVDDCTGRIVAPAQLSVGAAKGSISCSSGHSWEMHEWLTLRHLISRQQEAA
ncbi:hypothetical protein ACFVDU_29815 [Streptomyces albidoflavus]